MMPAIKKTFDLIGNDMVELSTEFESLNNKIGSYDEKWLGETKTKLLKHIDDEKTALILMSRLEKQMKKTIVNGSY